MDIQAKDYEASYIENKKEYRIERLSNEILSFDFVDELVEKLANNYGEINTLTGKQHFNAIIGEPEFIDHRVLKKELWLLRSIHDEGKNIVGYYVATIKKGGCVKIGPNYIPEAFQSKGLAFFFVRELITIYKNEHLRKLYFTLTEKYYKRLLPALMLLGLETEAILEEQYKQKCREYVVAKTLNAGMMKESPSKIDTNSSAMPVGEIFVKPVDFIHENQVLEIKALMTHGYAHYYESLEQIFINSTIAACERLNINVPLVEQYHLKVQSIFKVVGASNELFGVVVLAYKRGGAVKADWFLSDELINNKFQTVTSQIENWLTLRFHSRRIYSIVPDSLIELSKTMLENGYKSEGILNQPYKANCNCIVLGKKL